MELMLNLAKIKLSEEGYLPDYPYHLIAKEELCESFLSVNSETGMFFDYYPCLSETLRPMYDDLVSAIRDILHKFCLRRGDPERIDDIPDWVYSYMLGHVISVNSSKDDIHDLLVQLNCDNLPDDFTAEASRLCYEVSKHWIVDDVKNAKLDRPPTLFGEPHVLKALRVITR